MTSLLESLLNGRSKAHSKNMPLKSASRYPGKLVGFSKKAVEAAHLILRHLNLAPKSTIDLECTLNKKFTCRRLFLLGCDSKHCRALDAHRIKIVYILGLFDCALGRMFVGKRMPGIIAAHDGSLGLIALFILSAQQLPDKCRQRSRAGNERNGQGADVVDCHRMMMSG